MGGRQLKVPKSPWLFYDPHPTNKKSTSKRAERTRKTKSGPGQRMGAVSPVQYVLRVKEGKGSFCQKRSGGKNGKTEKGK